MIAAAAALSVISLSSQVPAEIRLPDGIDAATLAVRVQATETHFLAQNASPYTQVLFLGTAQLGHAATLRLAPGAEVLFPFARGTIDNLWIETLAILPDGWLNTGALSIEDLRHSEDDAIWITIANDYAIGWTNGRRGLVHAQPVGGLIPAPYFSSVNAKRMTNYSASEASVHVPIITPEDKEEEKPPVIEDKPLPPV